MTRQRARGALVWAVLAGAAVLCAYPARVRADIKIGFIDSDRIFAEYPKTQEAQASFNREVMELSKTAKEKKTEIDDLQRKLDQQSPMLSEAKRDEQTRELQRKVSEYETFVQTNWGPGGRISKLNEEFLKPIVDRVHTIVAEFGNEEGYSLILDAADGNVVFGDKTLDLTDRVLSALKDEDAGIRRTTPRSTQGTGTNQTTGNQGQQQ
jgi:outer membrane protein